MNNKQFLEKIADVTRTQTIVNDGSVVAAESSDETMTEADLLLAYREQLRGRMPQIKNILDRKKDGSISREEARSQMHAVVENLLGAVRQDSESEYGKFEE